MRRASTRPTGCWPDSATAATSTSAAWTGCARSRTRRVPTRRARTGCWARTSCRCRRGRAPRRKPRRGCNAPRTRASRPRSIGSPIFACAAGASRARPRARWPCSSDSPRAASSAPRGRRVISRTRPGRVPTPGSPRARLRVPARSAIRPRITRSACVSRPVRASRAMPRSRALSCCARPMRVSPMHARPRTNSCPRRKPARRPRIGMRASRRTSTRPTACSRPSCRASIRRMARSIRRWRSSRRISRRSAIRRCASRMGASRLRRAARRRRRRLRATGTGSRNIRAWRPARTSRPARNALTSCTRSAIRWPGHAISCAVATTTIRRSRISTAAVGRSARCTPTRSCAASSSASPT